MIDALFAAFLNVLNPANFALLFAGSALGLLVGVIPGLSSPMALAILIPVAFGMEPVSAFMILIGTYVGTKTGGAFSAILIRTPGTPAAASTAMEGHPMAQRGEAGRAMSLAIGASFVGGTLSWLVAVPLVGVIGIYAVRISAADLAMIGILALCAVASLSGKDLFKGLIAAALGLLISTIGLDELTGTPRMTLGFYQLYSGIPILPAIIGLFAIATVLIDIEDQHNKPSQKPQSSAFSIRAMILDLWIMRRVLGVGAVIGSLLGIVPGVGSDTAGWLSYAYVKKRVQQGLLGGGRKIGEGVPEGVAGPESANNAVTSGAIIPMLTLGIPGDGSTAIMLGALMLFGLQPGPLFFTESPEVGYGVLIALGIANFTTLVAAILLIRPFVALLRIDRSLLLGTVLVLGLVGAYAGSNASFEMIIALVFGVLGYFMHRFSYPLPALALGLILGPMIESNFRRALLIERGDTTVFVTSPISLICILVIAAIGVKFGFDLYRQKQGPGTPNRHLKTNDKTQSNGRKQHEFLE